MDIIPDVRISEQTQLDFIQKNKFPPRTESLNTFFLFFAAIVSIVLKERKGLEELRHYVNLATCSASLTLPKMWKKNS